MNGNPSVLTMLKIEARKRRKARTESTFTDPSSSFAFRGAAAALMQCTEGEVILEGPAGTGKSLACFARIHDLCRRNGNVRVLVLRKTRSSLTETGLVTFEKDVLGETHPMVLGHAKRAARHSYLYPNGSEIVVGGLDKPEKVLSSDYDAAYVQQTEECSEHDWETVSTRLRHGALPFQQMIGDVNPSTPNHWIRARAERGELRLLHSRHKDNPRLWEGGDWTPYGKQYVEGRLGKLTGVRRSRLLEGLWVAAEGMVYGGQWDAEKHLVPRFDVPPDWRRIRVIDFGYTNPFVCLWFAFDPDGRLVRYRQIYMTQRTVKVHAAEINRLSAGEHYEATICDHDAEDRATLEENGIPNSPAYKDVVRGYQAVQERLKPAGDGRPRLLFMEDSLAEVDQELALAGKPTSDVQEVEGYVFETGRDGKPNKELPLKVDDHGMDCWRYGVAYADNIGNPVGGWLAVMGKHGGPL